MASCSFGHVSIDQRGFKHIFSGLSGLQFIAGSLLKCLSIAQNDTICCI